MRKRLFGFLVLAFVIAGFFATAQPAQARSIHIPPLIGCDSLINWPCPGPVLVDP